MTTTIGANLPIAHHTFAQSPLHIPDGCGGAYKTELVIERSPAHTVKINWWHGPDPRKEPHSHPWHFSSFILYGGYTHVRFRVHDGNVYKDPCSVRAGDLVNVRADEYHLVTEILPGTVTRMTCGPLVNGGAWRLMDPETGETWDAKPDPDFRAALVALNPHLRK